MDKVTKNLFADLQSLDSVRNSCKTMMMTTKKDTFLSLKLDVPSSYKTYTVIPLLHGGMKIQKFMKNETTGIRKTMTVCSYNVTYTFQSESTLYSCFNVKELFARNKRNIWSLSHYNWTLTHNHLVRKRTLNQIIELCCEYLSLPCIWLYVLIMSRTRFRVNLHSIVVSI